MDSLHDFSRFQERNAPDSSAPTLPTAQAIAAAEASLPDASADSYLSGRPAIDTANHILRDIVPALNGQARSARYYGFVIGGVLPIAEWADNVVSRADQNVQVHFPAQTVATRVEATALQMLLHLLHFDAASWAGRTFTTGATGSNVLGLACAREHIIARRGGNVGEDGLLQACRDAGVESIQVLTSAGHSSLAKAASVIGLGRGSVRDVKASEAEPWRLDLDKVEQELRRPGTASIIAITAGDVNAGGFALESRDEWLRLRALADSHGAWIHVDGAMGAFVRALPSEAQYALLRERADGIDLADSITLDGHKLLNVPYDCGIFFTRSLTTLQAAFTNPNAAYLATSDTTVPSPLNIGLENSRRFRALPVYAVLLSEGRPGIAKMLANMVDLSRRLASYLAASPHYDLLTASPESIFMIIMFRAKDEALNDELVAKINATRDMYVSGTSWQGRKAVRVAVSNWKVDVERDYGVVTGILDAVTQLP